MTKRDKIKVIIAIVLLIGFTIGYIYGDITASTPEDKPKSGYQLLQEGLERVGEQ